MQTTKIWYITLRDLFGHDGVANGGSYGISARVWASRPGIVSKETTENHYKCTPGRLSYHEERVVVRISLTQEFDPECDWVAVERTLRSQFYHGGTRWEVLAGKPPSNADFPALWEQWVSDMEPLAADWLARHPNDRIAEAAQHAARKVSKNLKCSAWRDVAAIAGLDPDKIQRGESWTQIRAMPVRIAERLGWRPPHPRPRYGSWDAVEKTLVAG